MEAIRETTTVLEEEPKPKPWERPFYRQGRARAKYRKHMRRLMRARRRWVEIEQERCLLPIELREPLDLPKAHKCQHYLRKQLRHMHLALGFHKGRAYRDIERSCAEAPSAALVAHYWHMFFRGMPAALSEVVRPEDVIQGWLALESTERV